MLIPKYPKVDLSPAQIDRLMAVVNEAADAASGPSKQNFRQRLNVENKESQGGFDPVTIADRQAELAIKEVVQREFPDHGFLGEEFGEQGHAENQPLWIVDPIDGTRAYITGMPLWGTLIAVYDGADVVLGVLEQPILQERFIGTQFSNASSELITPSDRRRLNTRSTTQLDNAIAQTTTPDFFVEGDVARQFDALKKSVSMIRYGGDCYCYALLAMGFIDVVVERLLQPYDIAALIPIVQGAGGVVTDWSGGSAVSGGAVVASANRELHEKVLSLLNAAV